MPWQGLTLFILFFSSLGGRRLPPVVLGGCVTVRGMLKCNRRRSRFVWEAIERSSQKNTRKRKRKKRAKKKCGGKSENGRRDIERELLYAATYHSSNLVPFLPTYSHRRGEQENSTHQEMDSSVNVMKWGI